jgi:hypothetical protein
MLYNNESVNLASIKHQKYISLKKNCNTPLQITMRFYGYLTSLLMFYNINLQIHRIQMIIDNLVKVEFQKCRFYLQYISAFAG